MNVSLVTEGLNSDNLVKVGYNSQTQMPDFSLTFEGRIVNENGEILLSVPEGVRFDVNTTLGLPPKLIVATEYYQIQPVFSDFTSNKIYSLPDFQFEHNYYPDRISRANFGLAGEKYFSVTIGASHTDIYNSDHTLWKTINFEDNGNPVYGNVVDISQTTLNSDPLIELSYNYYTENGFHSKIIDELGDELLSIPECIGIQISQIEGLEDKLLGKFYDGEENEYKGVAVYGIDANLENMAFNENSLAVFPNPSSNYININSSEKIISCKIYNTSGF